MDRVQYSQKSIANLTGGIRMTDEQFDQLIDELNQQKRILASIGFYLNAQFWALVILVGVSLVSMIVLMTQ